MKKIAKANNNIFMDFAIVILITFTTESLWLNFSGLKGYYFKMIVPIFMATCFFVKHLNKNKGFVDRKFLHLFFVCVICLSSSVIQKSSFGMLISYLMLLVFAYIFTLNFDFIKFVDIYKKLMFVQCCLAVIMWLIAQYFSNIITLPQITFYQATTGEPQQYYSFFYITNMLQRVLDDGFFRASGAFWEPGIFQAYIILSILFEFIYPNEKGKRGFFFIIIHVIALAITFSTTGYLGLGCVIIYMLLCGNKTAGLKWYVKYSLLILIVLFVYFLLTNEDIYLKVFGKIEENDGSFISRFASWIGNIKLAFRYPVFGVGYGNSAKMLNLIMGEYSLGEYLHQTNTFTNYFATWGFLVGCYFVYGWIKFCRRISSNSFYAFFLFFILVIITSGENFLPSMFFNVLIFYGINHNNSISEKVMR